MGTVNKKKNALANIANIGKRMNTIMSAPTSVNTSKEVSSAPLEADTISDESSDVTLSANAIVQSARSAKCNCDETSSNPAGDVETMPFEPIEVNIDIDKTQGNAIYSSLLGLQNTLDNFQLDVKQEPLRQVVFDAIKDAIKEHMDQKDKARQENEEKLRSEGKPGTVWEAYQWSTQNNTDAINKFNKNSNAIKNQYNVIADSLCEILGRINLSPYEKPKFKDDKGHILLNSLYLYPWYYFKCFYSSKHVRGFFKFIAWSIWVITLGLLFFIARDNVILQKQMNINRYVHAYFSDNDDVTMELEGIDLMFSDQKVKPIPIKAYRECMKERKKEKKDTTPKKK